MGQNQVVAYPENPLSRMVSSGGIVIHKQCLICNSKLRSQAEAMHDKGDSLNSIRLLFEANNEPIAPYKIKYHFEAHYKLAAELALSEYAESLQAMASRHRSMIDDLEHIIAAGWIEFGRIAVIQTGTDINKEQQRQKMLMEAVRVIRETHETLKSMEDGEARYAALKNQFVQTWTLKIEKAPTDEERNMLISTLKDFQENLEAKQPEVGKA